MYLHKTKNGHYTPPCCYFSGKLEVVECLPQTFSGAYIIRAGRLAEMKNTEREKKRADIAQSRIKELEAELKKYREKTTV